MFLYYEVFDDPDPAKIVTEMVLSSDGVSSHVNWKNKADQAFVKFFGAKGGLLSNVPAANRVYDEISHIHTIIGHYGKVLTVSMESMVTQGLLANLTIKKITDLSQKAASKRLNRSTLVDTSSTNQKYKEDDFFYSAPVSSTELSGAALISKLAALLELQPDVLSAETDSGKLKKLYRSAAMKYHPDRNNGDGSKMSELNMLWNIFMQRSS